MSSPDPHQSPTLSVSQLNRKARQLLEMHLQQVWVEGELSNLATPSSGHWYFSLKDANAQVRCAMFRGANLRVKNRPKEGSLVKVRAKVSLYEGRGEYQLIVETLEDAGIGALQRAFEALKQKLQDEGLFDQTFKQALPHYPSHIGVVTSPTGAAIHDILSVLKRRYPLATVTVFPVAVQGKGAAAEIATAIERANHHTVTRAPDVLIVGRGGGSLEDLWAFNEEVVARAIFASEIPVVSAVGHEIDFSIADFVADLRAPTPSAAAELVVPDQRKLQDLFNGFAQKMYRTMHQHLQQQRQELRIVSKALKHPGQSLQEKAQHLDHLELRLLHLISQRVEKSRRQHEQMGTRLTRQEPSHTLDRLTAKVIALNKHSRQLMQQLLKDKQQHMIRLTQVLHGVSPLNTLNRGYAIVKTEQGQVIQRSTDVRVGDTIRSQLREGVLESQITKII